LLEFLGVLALAMPFAVAVAGLAGYRMAGRALAPLDEMASTTEQITASRLGDRIPVENANDELGHMAQVLNGLLARIEESFEQLKRFTSDVSHELRTPLASLRSVGEVGLQREHDAAEYENIIGSMLEEAEKLSSMIDALLSIAHADSGTAELHRTVFDLADLVQESVAIVSVLAEEKTQTISIKGDAGVCVSADRNFLRMALINLLDNAVKYSPVGSVIKLCWDSSSKQNHNTSLVKLTVEDEGPGVPERERQRVFQRFYRLDEARNRDSGGAGLGLAIAKCLVQAHGGEITLDSGSKGGSVFTIRLPITEHQLVSS
jgi:heavy metal sensor kinase